MNQQPKLSLARRGIHQVIKLISQLGSKNKLNILIYHQVVTQRDPMRPDEPTLDEFTQQMALIKQYYQPIALSKAVELLAQSKLPANSICVTFDDGYLNNMTVAAPVLNVMGIPATLFVATRFSHGENMWNDNLTDLISDDNRNKFDLSLIGLGICFVETVDQRRKLAGKVIMKVKYLNYGERAKLVNQILLVNGRFSAPAKMMTPTQLQEIALSGFEVAGHTQDHPILAVLNKQEQHQQISQGKGELEDWINGEVKGFAYPNGKWGKDYNETSLQVLTQCNFNYAVATDEGISTPKTNPLQLKRFTPWQKDLLKFHLKLLINTVKPTV